MWGSAISVSEAIQSGLSIIAPLEDEHDLLWRRLAYAQRHGTLPRCRYCGRELARRTSTVCTRRACLSRRATERSAMLREQLGEAYLAQRRAWYERHRAPCVDCAGLREPGSKSPRCAACLRAHRRALATARQRRLRARRAS